MSEGGDDGGEKTFDPTPQRLAEARRKGDIPRSTDVTAAATYLALLAVCATAGGAALVGAGSVLELFLAQPDRLMGLVLGPGGPKLLGSIAGELLTALAPIFLVPIGAVLVSLAAQQAITFSGDKIQPKLSRLSILANAKRKFGVTGIVEFLKSLVKLAAVAGALFFYLARDLDPMIGASTAEATVLGAMLMDSLVVLLTITTVIACTVAGVDLVWQRFDHARRLRMSFQDMRDENKQSEGDPHMKAQRRSRGEALATNRMLLDVPKADVVIVNPDPRRRRAEVEPRQGLGAGLRRQGRGRARPPDPRDRRHRRRAAPRGPAHRPGAPRHRRGRPRDPSRPLPRRRGGDPLLRQDARRGAGAGAVAGAAPVMPVPVDPFAPHARRPARGCRPHLADLGYTNPRAPACPRQARQRARQAGARGLRPDGSARHPSASALARSSRRTCACLAKGRFAAGHQRAIRPEAA